MTVTGELLRRLRHRIRLSQARLAELTDLPQHTLSAFELGKTDLCREDKRKLQDVLSNLGKHRPIIERKKRYRQHSFSHSFHDSDRSVYAFKSNGNSEYLDSINKLLTDRKTPLKGISLFSGCGGFTLGFRSSGFDIVGFVEIDDELSHIYSLNFPSAKRIGPDITQIGSRDIRNIKHEFGDIDVLIGGPPCQGFSLSGKRDVRDQRNYLFNDFMRFVDALDPKVAVIENVRLITSMKSKDGGYVKDQIVGGFLSHGYNARLFKVNAYNYGVPQHRERVFFIAVRSDLQIAPTFPEPEFGNLENLFQKPLRTFADACSDLAYLESGQRTEDPLHAAVKHPDHVIRWLWDVPQGASAHENRDPDLRPPSGYNTTYKRQVWNRPAATVQTTFGMISGCRNVHPIATRSLTAREAARLQSFPDNFVFKGTIGTIRTGIGNAVPPLLARSIANYLRASIFDLVKVTGL